MSRGKMKGDNSANRSAAKRAAPAAQPRNRKIGKQHNEKANNTKSNRQWVAHLLPPVRKVALSAYSAAGFRALRSRSARSRTAS